MEDILKMFSARLVLLCLILVSANFVHAVIPLHIFTYLASASYAAHLLLNLSSIEGPFIMKEINPKAMAAFQKALKMVPESLQTTFQEKLT